MCTDGLILKNSIQQRDYYISVKVDDIDYLYDCDINVHTKLISDGDGNKKQITSLSILVYLSDKTSSYFSNTLSDIGRSYNICISMHNRNSDNVNVIYDSKLVLKEKIVNTNKDKITLEMLFDDM